MKQDERIKRVKDLYRGKPTWDALAELADSGELLDVVKEMMVAYDSKIAELRELLSEADEAIEAAYRQADAEWRDHQSVEDRCEKKIRAFKEKANAWRQAMGDENKFWVPPVYYWEPHEDITAYELALCVPVFHAGTYSGQAVYEIIQGLPDIATRHFRREEASDE